MPNRAQLEQFGRDTWDWCLRHQTLCTHAAVFLGGLIAGAWLF